MQDQARVAIEEADLVLFVVDAAAGIAPLDHEVADRLRRAGKPTILVVNKADNPRREHEGAEFYALGFEPTHRRSARSTAAAPATSLDLVVERLPPASRESDPEASVYDERDLAEGDLAELAETEMGPPRVAIVGRPNTGKSTFVNRVLGEERMIVSDDPGHHPRPGRLARSRSMASR